MDQDLKMQDQLLSVSSEETEQESVLLEEPPVPPPPPKAQGEDRDRTEKQSP